MMRSAQGLFPVLVIKGRGVSHQQPHRFERDQRAAFDDGWDTLSTLAEAPEAPPATQVIWEDARSAITRNDSPDIGYSLGLNVTSPRLRNSLKRTLSSSPLFGGPSCDSKPVVSRLHNCRPSPCMTQLTRWPTSMRPSSRTGRRRLSGPFPQRSQPLPAARLVSGS